MDNATASVPESPPDQLLASLARINHRLSLLRGWLSHDHHDEPFWWARRQNAPSAQRERGLLQALAHVMHTARAASRGRVHCARFADLDAQTAWLAKHETTLARMRAGEVA